MKPVLSNIRFIFDVESIGLHGQPYAVGYVVHKDGVCVAENSFSCPTDAVPGDDDDRAWVEANCPKLPITHESSDGVMEAFWDAWMYWKKQGAQMFAECAWPVESHFLSCCIVREYPATKWEGPYPLFDVSSIMAAAGMDPLGTYPRADNEVQHDPLGDARHSATLLAIAIHTLTEKRSVGLTFGDAIAALEGLRDVDGLREVLWPDEESRPSRRFIWGLKRARAIPFISMRGRTWYEPAKVLAALRKMESAAIL